MPHNMEVDHCLGRWCMALRASDTAEQLLCVVMQPFFSLSSLLVSTLLVRSLVRLETFTASVEPVLGSDSCKNSAPPELLRSRACRYRPVTLPCMLKEKRSRTKGWCCCHVICCQDLQPESKRVVCLFACIRPPKAHEHLARLQSFDSLKIPVLRNHRSKPCRLFSSRLKHSTPRLHHLISPPTHSHTPSSPSKDSQAAKTTSSAPPSPPLLPSPAPPPKPTSDSTAPIPTLRIYAAPSAILLRVSKSPSPCPSPASKHDFHHPPSTPKSI